MDKNRTEGSKHEVKGGLKEATGKLTGNKSGELEGKVEKNVGEAQRKLGETADRERADRDTRH